MSELSLSKSFFVSDISVFLSGSSATSSVASGVTSASDASSSSSARDLKAFLSIMMFLENISVPSFNVPVIVNDNCLKSVLFVSCKSSSIIYQQLSQISPAL